MKPAYTEHEYNMSKSKDKLPCICYTCNKLFFKTKLEITFELKHNEGYVKYCSRRCKDKSQELKQKVICLQCDKEFYKTLSQINKFSNHFCSQSCSATYNNKNKKHGTRRSKLEIWLEEQLTQLYPNLQMEFNQKDAIGSELDIYIPSLNLAFELNGIFHYEPIYGVNKLNQIQNNDKSKSKACHDTKIDLCIIDTSGQTYVKPSTSQKYLNIIINIINERIK